jgi:DNA-binding beta-propeller fold protein YncE
MSLPRQPRRIVSAALAALLLTAVPALAAFTERWVEELDKGAAGGVTVDAEGRVFATAQKNKGSVLYARAADGTELWKFKSKDTLDGVAMAADGTALIVVGATKSGKLGVAALDPATGDEIWSMSFDPANNYKARDGAFVSVSAKSGAIYVAAPIRKSGVCCAYAVGSLDTDGTLLWNHRTGAADGDQANVVSIAADPKGKGVFVSGSQAVDGVDTPFIARYAAADGAEQWRTFRDVTSAPASIAVTKNGKKIYLFAKKLDAGYFQVGLFTHKGKAKWLRPLLLSGNAGSRGEIALSANGKMLYMVASVLDNAFNERGFLMRTDTKTSGPMQVTSEIGEGEATWFRRIALGPDDTPVVLEQRFVQETGALRPVSLIVYDQ